MKHPALFKTIAALGLIILTANVAGLAGCGNRPTPAATNWTPAHADATPQISYATAQADQAIDALKNSLMTSLKQAMANGGPVQAIGVCHELAPTLAKEIGEAHGLKIGRTSIRQRSAANVPPTWAQAAVDRHESAPLVFTSSDGAVAFLRPIHLMPACIQCHGNAEQISPDVQTLLNQQYPNDQATGFAVGELRGYFWVQVPPPTPTPASENP